MASRSYKQPHSCSSAHSPSHHRMSVLLLLVLCTLAMRLRGCLHPSQPPGLASPLPWLQQLLCAGYRKWHPAGHQQGPKGWLRAEPQPSGDAREHRQEVSGGPGGARCLHKLGRLARAWERRDTCWLLLSESETCWVLLLSSARVLLPLSSIWNKC